MSMPVDIKKLYFLGIGGIGMSALARYFASAGVRIAGYDKTPTSLTQELIREGMEIHFDDDPGSIDPKTDMVIYSPAVPEETNEFRRIRELALPLKKRAEVLGMITSGRRTIAVAGTHGKTSISSMIAHVLHQAGIPMTALIGGISKNFRSNYISNSGNEGIYVVEADEFDRSFLQLHPDIAVITSMDPDHLDIYSTAAAMEASFREFAGQVRPGGTLVIRKGLDAGMAAGVRRIVYGLDGNEEVTAGNIAVGEGKFQAEIISGSRRIGMIHLKVPGRHNIENALAVVAVCQEAGVHPDKVISTLNSYEGVNRRFDIRVNRPGRVYIDDYAHHPRELEAFIMAVKELFPGKKITGVFQPHLYSRTRDLADGFAKSLDLLDDVYLLEIYPARERPIIGVSSAMILSGMKNATVRLASGDALLRDIRSSMPGILLTMGAGDIDQLVPVIEKMYLG